MHIPVKLVENLSCGLEADNFLEKPEASKALRVIGEVSESRAAPIFKSVHVSVETVNLIGSTYGQEIIDTSKIPTIIALLTLYAMR